MVAGEELMLPDAPLQGIPASEVSKTIFSFLSNRVMEIGLGMKRKTLIDSETHVAQFIQRWHEANIPLSG